MYTCLCIVNAIQVTLRCSSTTATKGQVNVPCIQSIVYADNYVRRPAAQHCKVQRKLRCTVQYHTTSTVQAACIKCHDYQSARKIYGCRTMPRGKPSDTEQYCTSSTTRGIRPRYTPQPHTMWNPCAGVQSEWTVRLAGGDMWVDCSVYWRSAQTMTDRTAEK